MRNAACLLLLLASAALALGCHVDAKFCPGAPRDNCSLIDAGTTGCTSDTDCSGALAVCDLATAACVQCTPAEPAACSGTTPLCSAGQCRACTAHGECASQACLPDGSCGDADAIAYVDPAGSDTSACSRDMPCTKIAAALATGRPVLKLHGTLTEPVSITGQSVTLLADPGAMLTSDRTGILLKVDGTGNRVAIHDLEITGALGPTGIGISLQAGNTTTLGLYRTRITHNDGGGIAAAGGTLIVLQSTVSANTTAGITASGSVVTISQSAITGNPGGGIAVTGGVLIVSQSTVSTNNGTGGGISISGAQFDITNTMINANGSPSSTYGGLVITSANDGLHNFQFNTVTQNTAKGLLVPGVLCAVIAMPIGFANNIVFGNGAGQQVDNTSCTWTYSDIGPTAIAGSGNFTADPMFVDPDHGDFHLLPGSPARNAADPAATAATDIDGDARPAGGRSDMGADEVAP